MVYHCFVCGKNCKENTGCTKCQNATYCSKQCQELDWNNGGHSKLCFNARDPKDVLLELELDLEDPFINHHTQEDFEEGKRILGQQDVNAAISWLVENRHNAYVPVSNYPHNHEEFCNYIGEEIEHIDELTSRFALQTFQERVQYIEGLRDTWNNFWEKRKEKKEAKKDKKRPKYEEKVVSNQKKAQKNRDKIEELEQKEPEWYRFDKKLKNKKDIASKKMRVMKYTKKAEKYSKKLE
jgi:hypothetical protein